MRYSLTSWPTPFNHTGLTVSLTVDSDIALDSRTGECFHPTICTGEHPIVCKAGIRYSKNGIGPLRCSIGIVTGNAKMRGECMANLEKTDGRTQVEQVAEGQFVMITWPITLMQRCENQDPKSVDIPLGVHLVHVSYDCVLSGEDWSLVGHLEKEGRLIVNEIQVVLLSPMKITQKIPETEAIQLIDNQPWSPLNPVVSRPLGQISAPLDPVMFNWTGHGGKMSWGSVFFQVILVGITVILIVLCIVKRRQIKAKIGRFVHNLHNVHQESLRALEGGTTISANTNSTPSRPSVFVFGTPSGGQLGNPTRSRLYPTLEHVDSEPNVATPEEDLWE
jgi:hypothetical protein